MLVGSWNLKEPKVEMLLHKRQMICEINFSRKIEILQPAHNISEHDLFWPSEKHVFTAGVQTAPSVSFLFPGAMLGISIYGCHNLI